MHHLYSVRSWSGKNRIVLLYTHILLVWSLNFLFQVVTVGQTSSARSSTVFEYFFNILDSGILPPLYSLEEFFGLKKIEDPDRSGILSQVSLTSDHQVSKCQSLLLLYYQSQTWTFKTLNLSYYYPTIIDNTSGMKMLK